MAELVHFNHLPLPAGCRFFEIPKWRVMTLGGNHLEAFHALFQLWLEARPHRQIRHNLQTLSLLADCEVLLNAAKVSLVNPRQRLRWQALEMTELSDRQLLIVILDNLREVNRSLIDLRRDERLLTGEREVGLTPIIHNLLRFIRRIEYLLDPTPGQVLPLKEDSSHE